MPVHAAALSRSSPAGGGNRAQLPALPVAALAAQRTARLPNGLDVRYVSKQDLLFLYKEVYEQRCYLQHGITLPRAGTVIDVGGNIGLTAMFCAELLGPQGTVVSCEPLPPTFDCLQHNVEAQRRSWQQRQQQQQQFAGSAAAGVSGNANSWQEQQQEQPDGSSTAGLAEIVALNVGVGDGSTSEATFTFYPHAAGWSSMRPDGQEVLSVMEGFLSNAFVSKDASSAAGIDWLSAAGGRLLWRWAPSWLYDAVWQAFVWRMMRDAQQYTCPLVTVSQLIRQQGLEAAGVDLLKVDVERAELDVLRGVEDCHWPLVRQLAVEVHGAELEAVLVLLRHTAGFSQVVVEQEPVMAGTGLYSIFCRRE